MEGEERQSVVKIEKLRKIMPCHLLFLEGAFNLLNKERIRAPGVDALILFLFEGRPLDSATPQTSMSTRFVDRLGGSGGQRKSPPPSRSSYCVSNSAEERV